MHSAQHQVALWRHSQMFLAAHAQRPLCNADRLADLRDVERLSLVLLHYSVKAAHHDRVLTLRQAVRALLLMTKTADHGLDQRLLEPTRSIRVGDNIRSLFCKPHRCSM